ncbi:MAG: aminoacyl-tRNA hydrolase [bacterium]|nr:aminoacyl-tRNA hydrolase [bacterium]
MKLIIGLGNPGEKHAKTRHNIGFRVLDSICDDYSLMAKCSALICKQEDVLYAKPQTFMNLSGVAVIALIQYYKIDLADILVVYDDKDIKFGDVRFREQGSSAGHNGMNSIIGVLGTNEFSRVRIGVAPTDEEAVIHNTADYVLSNFSKDEEAVLSDIIIEAKQSIIEFVNKKHSVS